MKLIFTFVMSKKHSVDCSKCAICPCRCCKAKQRKSSVVTEISRRCLLVLVRTGLSVDDVEKRYSGWNDCDLSSQGDEQMSQTGQLIREENLSFDLCFTSVLKRASQSLYCLQEQLDAHWLPVKNHWRLNDRMLGNLTGFHRDRAESLFGQCQLKEWLTRPDFSPPALEETNSFHPRFHLKYRSISSIVPSTETLLDLRQRLRPFFYDQLLNELSLGRNILLVTHEDVLKEILRLVKNLPIDTFIHQEIPIGHPIVLHYSLEKKDFIDGYYLSLSMEVDQKNFLPVHFENSSTKIN